MLGAGRLAFGRRAALRAGQCRDRAEAACVDIAADDLDGLVRLARDRAIDLVVVGPELPLTLGLVDRLQEAGIRALGPTAAAARLEGSKAFTKAFCARHRIPTAPWQSFTRAEVAAARAHVRTRAAPLVIKADGLAAGKGVVVASTVEEALAALDELFAGSAGATVLVEDCLTGIEASLFALCDGTTALEIGTAQDHKRAFEGDRGPNTGGMGAFSPSPHLDEATTERVMAEIVRPTLAGMAAEGTAYKGVLYAGLMLTADGPKLIEFNVRFGDPECQVVLPRLRTDLGQLLLGTVDGQLAHMDVRWEQHHALTVVMAARGYPGAFDRGSVIRGLERIDEDPDVMLFHAGTVRNADGHIAAAGGRVLNVTGLGATLAQARERAYSAVRLLDWPESFYRSDIGIEVTRPQPARRV